MSTDQPLPKPTSGDTAFWIAVTGLGQGWRFFLSVASTIILARMLVPADFGLVATVAPILGFIDLLRDAGFSQATVQRAEVSEQQSRGLFWLTMGLSLFLGTLLALTSPLIAAFFHEPRLTAILLISAVTMQVSSLSAQPWAWLNRHLRFKAIAAIDSAQGTIGLLVSIVAAQLTHSYWAIIYGGVMTTISGGVLVYWISGWRPGRPSFDRTVLQMAKFGAGVSFSNIFNFFARNSDNLLIARASGPYQLGLYDRAYKLMLLPLTQISWPISRVLTPVLSRLQTRPQEYRVLYLSTVSYIMAAIQPALIIATVYSGPVIRGLLGEKWAGSAPIFAWLGAAAVHQVATTTLGWLFLSQGRSRHYAVSGAFSSVTTVASFLIGLHWGPIGLAAAYTITDYLIRLPFSFWYAGRTGAVDSRALLSNAAPHIGACVVTAGAALLLSSVHVVEGLAGVVAATAGGYGVYAAVLALFPEKRSLALSAASRVRARLRQPAT